MPARTYSDLLRDRASDRSTIVAGIAKPPVLSRGTIRALCAACLLLIVYGTLGPLGTTRSPWVVPVADWTWRPPTVAMDFNDLLTNALVYVPVGVAFRLLVRRRGRAGWPDLLLGLVLSLALSYLTEVLQQAMPARSSSMTDVVVNGGAALVGCLLAVPVQRGVRRLHAALFWYVRDPVRLWRALALLSIGAAAALMTMPWRPGAFHMTLRFGERLTPADLRRVAMFVAVGFLLTGAGLVRGRGRMFAFSGAALQSSVVVAVLEASQAILKMHVCSLQHGLVAAVGAVAGCGLACAIVWSGPVLATPVAMLRVRRLTLAALGAALLYTVFAGLLDGQVEGCRRDEPVVSWVPFHGHFVRPFAEVVADVAEQMALYTLLTLMCLIMTAGRGRGVALLLLVGLIGLLELMRAFVQGHGADITTPLLAALAWLLTTRAWESVYPRMTRVSA